MIDCAAIADFLEERIHEFRYECCEGHIDIAEEWIAAFRKLQWTKEKPKEPGHYWYSRAYSKDFSLGTSGVALVAPLSEVTNPPANFGLCAFLPGDNVPVLLEQATLSGMWAGPIPEPTVEQ